MLVPATTIIFRMPAEPGGEMAMTAFLITPNRVRRVEGSKCEQTFPGHGGIYSKILTFVLSSSLCLLRVGAENNHCPMSSRFE